MSPEIITYLSTTVLILATIVGAVFRLMKYAQMLFKEQDRKMDEKIDNLRAELKADIARLDAKNDNVRVELKGDNTVMRAELKSDNTELKGEITELRTELKGENNELKADIAELRTELKGEIGKMMDLHTMAFTSLNNKFDYYVAWQNYTGYPPRPKTVIRQEEDLVAV
jgi:DNA-binding protein YbaB